LRRAHALAVMALALALGFGAFTGCAGDPEAKSGGDAYRNEAQPMPMGDWQVDDIAYGEGDRTDWKAVDVPQPAKLTIELSADEPDATFRVGFFDRHGMPLGRTVRKEGQAKASFQVDAPKRGRYFLMVQATGGPPTSYQVRVAVAGSSGGAGSSDLPDF